MANTPQNLTFWYQEPYVYTPAQAAVILKYQLRYVIAMDFTFTSFRLSLLVMLVTAVSMVRLVLKRKLYLQISTLLSELQLTLFSIHQISAGIAIFARFVLARDSKWLVLSRQF